MLKKSDKLIIIKGKPAAKKALFIATDMTSVIEICFNPNEYTIEKRNNFSEASIPGLGSPIIQFSSGNTRTLSIELMLDTYTYSNGEDIREKYIERLEKLIEVDGEFHAPPPCKVIWGSLEFVSVLDSMTKRYVFFKDDGTPVRARVTLSFKEYLPVDIQIMQSPRSSPNRFKKHLIKEGDSLWLLSSKEYGEPFHWRFIAEANKIDDPLSLEPGTEIILPPLRIQ